MSHDELDLELIAAFLDGKLDGQDRERVIALLGTSSVAYDLFVEALRLREALGEEGAKTEASERMAAAAGVFAPAEAAAGASPSQTAPGAAAGEAVAAGASSGGRSRALGRLPRWIPLAAAAGLAAVVAVGILRSPARFDSTVAALTRVPQADELPASWEAPVWTVLRGPGNARFAPEVIAFRAAVRSVDLDLALATGQSRTAEDLAAELAGLVGQAQGGGGLGQRYRRVRALAADAPDAAVEEAAQARAELATFLDAQRVRLGHWAELGRIAAMVGDREYLAGPGGRLPGAIETTRLPPTATSALGDVARLQSSGPPTDLSPLGAAFEALIAALGR